MNETENTDTGTDIEDKEEEQVITGSYPECAQMKEDTEQLSDRDIGSMSSWARIMDDQDIICIQELHSFDQELIHNFEKDVQGIFYTNTDCGWTGTGILIRNNIQNFKIEHLEIKPSIFKNRITHLRIHLNHPINIINIYAPANNSEKPNFYKAFYNYLEQISGTIILAGDFNYASENIDRFPKVNKYDKRVQKNL